MKHLYMLGTAMLAAAALAACDCDHFEPSPEPFKLGHVLCSDGDVLSFCDYVKSDKNAVGVVYWVNPDPEADISGYAVYLADSPGEAFSDSIPFSQGTSASVTECDGNENTYALFSTDKVKSPIAESCFDIWVYGQSAYIPSVAQLRQLQMAKDYINPRIEAIGGDPLPEDPDECWYWSSTEVEGQDKHKAWLVSMKTGMMHETPKDQRHKTRPVVTIYKFR